MHCPQCGGSQSHVSSSKKDDGFVQRVRVCDSTSCMNAFITHEYIVCPDCKTQHSVVKETRKIGKIVHRTRLCSKCGLSMTTFEEAKSKSEMKPRILTSTTSTTSTSSTSTTSTTSTTAPPHEEGEIDIFEEALKKEEKKDEPKKRGPGRPRKGSKSNN